MTEHENGRQKIGTCGPVRLYGWPHSHHHISVEIDVAASVDLEVVDSGKK